MKKTAVRTISKQHFETKFLKTAAVYEVRKKSQERSANLLSKMKKNCLSGDLCIFFLKI
jgi:hypothetical protein